MPHDSFFRRAAALARRAYWILAALTWLLFFFHACRSWYQVWTWPEHIPYGWLLHISSGMYFSLCIAIAIVSGMMMRARKHQKREPLPARRIDVLPVALISAIFCAQMMMSSLFNLLHGPATAETFYTHMLSPMYLWITGFFGLVGALVLTASLKIMLED